MENDAIEDSGESQEQAEGESLKPRAKPDMLRDLARLMAEGTGIDEDAIAEPDDGESQESEQAGGHGETQKPPKTLAEAAERLGLDVAELYKLQIPDAHREGESHSLGELKNAVDKQSEFAVDRLAWEETRAKQQAELLRGTQELEELLRHVPKRLLETDALNAAKARLDARANEERRKTLEVIPEWRNDSRRSEEIGQMIQHMQGYGFSKEFLATVTDHKTIRYIRENWLREKRINEALAMVNKVGTSEGKPGKPNGKRQPQQPAARQSSPNAKRAELIGLLQPSEG